MAKVPYFEWSDRLKTGVSAIDVQHRELVAAVNELGEAIEQGRGASAIQKLMVFMKYYAEWHFGHEESLAQKHRCPMAEVNRQAHLQFLRLFEDLQGRYRQRGTAATIDTTEEALALEVHTKLADWLVNHIMKIDRSVGEHICAQKC